MILDTPISRGTLPRLDLCRPSVPTWSTGYGCHASYGTWNPFEFDFPTRLPIPLSCIMHSHESRPFRSGLLVRVIGGRLNVLLRPPSHDSYSSNRPETTDIHFTSSMLLRGTCKVPATSDSDSRSPRVKITCRRHNDPRLQASRLEQPVSTAREARLAQLVERETLIKDTSQGCGSDRRIELSP